MEGGPTATNDFVVATFNLENLDNTESLWPKRKDVLRPMLERMNADILFLQEVNKLSALDDLVRGTRYENYHRAHSTKPDGSPYSKRNLVTLSRYRIHEKKQYHHNLVPKPTWRAATAEPPEESKEVEWERPILHCETPLKADRILHVINVHLKSKNPSEIKGQTDERRRYVWLSHEGWAEGYFLSSVKRVGQALETRRLLERIFSQDRLALIAVGGDFNSDVSDVPLKAVIGSVSDTSNPELRDRVMVPCEYNVPPDQRYSLIYHGKGEMLDHVIVSQAFYPHWVETAVFNELLPDKSIAFATEEKFPESDHAPVVARFHVPEDFLP